VGLWEKEGNKKNHYTGYKGLGQEKTETTSPPKKKEVTKKNRKKEAGGGGKRKERSPSTTKILKGVNGELGK